MNSRGIARLLALMAVSWCLRATAESAPEPRAMKASTTQPMLVIIIDDMGDNLARGLHALSLPGPVTYAILPHSPFARQFANIGHAEGKEIMLHAPMENTQDLPLGPGALTQGMDRETFVATLRADLASVPHRIGLNNHMGSLLTQLQEPMTWVMEELKSSQLFFVDSSTTSDSVAWKIADRLGLPYLRRDVFLDHERTTEFVHQQFQEAIDRARRQGFAVAIGHPHEVTISYLAEAIDRLGEIGIQLVSPSGLLLAQSEQRQLTLYAAEQKSLRSPLINLSECSVDTC